MVFDELHKHKNLNDTSYTKLTERNTVNGKISKDNVISLGTLVPNSRD